MAIEYFLYASSADSPDKVQHRAASRGGPAVAIRAKLLTEPLITHVREDYGLRANVSMYFRLDKSDLGRSGDALMDCLSGLYADGLRDGVLLFNGEKVAMRAVDGAFTFSSTFGVWTAERLARFGRPYTLAALRSPALEPEPER